LALFLGSRIHPSRRRNACALLRSLRLRHAQRGPRRARQTPPTLGGPPRASLLTCSSNGHENRPSFWGGGSARSLPALAGGAGKIVSDDRPRTTSHATLALIGPRSARHRPHPIAYYAPQTLSSSRGVPARSALFRAADAEPRGRSA